MTWTKKHSKNAVAAKERKRLERANADVIDFAYRGPSPRKAKADFIFRIEDRFGERIQVSAFRFMGRVHLSTGQSVRSFCRGLEHLLTKSA